MDLYDFNCSTGGCTPEDFGQLARWTDGKLYGTTQFGGTNNLGTIFSVNPDGTGYSDLWNFDSTVGGGSTTSSLMLASDGNFYGEGNGKSCGASSAGMLYRFVPPSTLQPLYYFPCPGYAQSALVQAKDSNLYGVSSSGIFRLSLKGKFTPLPNSSVGGHTFAPLMQASDGNLYGTTIDGGGVSACGTIFRSSISGGTKSLYLFTGANQYSPYSPLFQAADGNLYGTTFGPNTACNTIGGSQLGTVFQFIPGKTPTLNTIHTFTGSDGGYPYAGLVAGPSGSLIGVASGDGANGDGTVFGIAPSSPYTFTKLADFALSNSSAQATLFLNTDGYYYGLAFGGGASGGGYLYKLVPPAPVPNILVEGPIYVLPGTPVTFLGDNLQQIQSVTFAGVQAQFQPGSATFFIATVPSAALDGPVVATIINSAGGQQQLQSQQNVRILPKITNLDPTSGPVGQGVGITGGGFAGTTKVTFGGVTATAFSVQSPTFIQTTVPAGAKTGKIVVTTPNGTAASKQTFTVN